MTRAPRALPLVVAILSACSTLAFRIAPDFPDDDQIEIARALAEWNAIVKPEHRLRLGSDWQIVRVAPADGYNGYTIHSERTIQVSPAPRDKTPAGTIVLHEAGHALGLQHTCVAPDAAISKAAPGAPRCDPGHSLGVMDPTHATTTPFTEADRAECRRVGVCR